MLVRRSVYAQLGGFDERFFMYAEETDWQLRMRDAGWSVRFDPAAEVVHLGGASVGEKKANISRHFFDSLDKYELKHHGRAGLLSLRLAMIVGCALRAVGWAVLLLVNVPKRDIALAKLKLHIRLVHRQATHWHADLFMKI
jgi:GT2 family glycosyltransferase